MVSAPGVLHGQYRIEGTRIPVSVILDNLAGGVSFAELVDSYCSISPPDVLSALAFAADLVRALPPAHHIRARAVEVRGECIDVTLQDGRGLRVPLAWYPSLDGAEASDRHKCHLIGDGLGIRWPELDEDLSVIALLVHCCGFPGSADLKAISRGGSRHVDHEATRATD